MKILEAARASGLSADRIRLYERQRILPRPRRRNNGYRDYTEEDVVTMRLARVLRDLRLPLEDVGSLIALCDDGTCGELRDRLLSRLSQALEETEARILELQHTRKLVGVLRSDLEQIPPVPRGISRLAPCDCVRLCLGPDRR